MNLLIKKDQKRSKFSMWRKVQINEKWFHVLLLQFVFFRYGFNLLLRKAQNVITAFPVFIIWFPLFIIHTMFSVQFFTIFYFQSPGELLVAPSLLDVFSRILQSDANWNWGAILIFHKAEMGSRWVAHYCSADLISEGVFNISKPFNSLSETSKTYSL